MADVRAWLLWALTLLLAASYSRNPLYSILLLLVTLWAYTTPAAPGEEDVTPRVPLRFALFAVPLAAIFNALSTHIGATVLFRLPGWLPLFGGPITLEAFIFGTVNGINLTVIFSAFMAFNRAIAVRDLLKLTPRAFHESGVVLSIALTFVPQTVRSLHRIREAQAVRGHRVRGLHDWLPIFTPLLVSALERAFTLAETMVARGYAATTAPQPIRTRVLLILGLLATLGGWLAYLFAPTLRPFAITTLALGVIVLGMALWLAGRTVRHTIYRPGHWRLRDTLVVTGCLPTLILLLAQRSMLYYTPYPAFTWPPFAPLAGISILGLLVPALVTAHADD